MEPPFPEYDADEKREPKPAPAAAPTRLRDVSVRLLIPNLITLGAICAGLTGVRLAVEGRFELTLSLWYLQLFWMVLMAAPHGS